MGSPIRVYSLLDCQAMTLRVFLGSSFGTSSAGISPSPSSGNFQQLAKLSRQQAPRGRVISSRSCRVTSHSLCFCVGTCSQYCRWFCRFAEDSEHKRQPLCRSVRREFRWTSALLPLITTRPWSLQVFALNAALTDSVAALCARSPPLSPTSDT